MWETTCSFTRAAVLALVTCSFAAIWSGDQQTQAAFALARHDAWQQRTDPALAASPAPVRDGGAAPTAAPRTTFRRVTTVMELPADIAPGRYRVVEPSGRTMRIIVADDPQAVCWSPRDLYLFDMADGSRRYFVRIDSDETMTSPAQQAASGSSSRRQ